MATKGESAVEKAVREVCVHHENMNVYIAQGDIVGALTSAKLTANTLAMLKLLVSEDPARALALSTEVCKTAKEQNKVCQLVRCNLDDTMQLVLAQVRDLEKKYKKQRGAAFAASTSGGASSAGVTGEGEGDKQGESCGASCGELERLKQQFSLGSDACKNWFDTVFGLDNAKKDIENGFINPLLYPCMYPSLSKGVLLYGPPGTGKTQLAKAAVNELRTSNPNVDVVFLAPTGADLQGKYVGETEKNIRQIFECAAYFARANERCARIAAAAAAAAAPAGDDKEKKKEKNKKLDLEDDIARKRSIAVLFIDEVDTVGGDRNKDPSGTMAKSVNALLQAMDGIASAPNVVVMAATNKPWSLDTAFLRRFDSTVYVPLPKAEDIEQLLNLYITRYVKTDCRDPTEIRINVSGMPKVVVSFKATGAELLDKVAEAAEKKVRAMRIESTGKLVDMAKKLYEQGVVDNTVLTIDDASSTTAASSTSLQLTAVEKIAREGAKDEEGDEEDESFGSVCKRKSARRGGQKQKGGCAGDGGAPCAKVDKKKEKKEDWYDLKEKDLIPLTRSEVAALALQLAKQKYSGSDVERLFKHVTRSAAQVALQYGVFYKLTGSNKYLSATTLPFGVGGKESTLVDKTNPVITSAIKFESIEVDNVTYLNTKLVSSPTLAIGDSTVDEMYLAKGGEENYRVLASIKHKYVDETKNTHVTKTLYLQSDIPPVGRSFGQLTMQGLKFLASLSSILTGGDTSGEKTEKQEKEKTAAEEQFAQFIQSNLLGQLLSNLKTVYVIGEEGGAKAQKYSLKTNEIVDQSETLPLLIYGETVLQNGETFASAPLPIVVEEEPLAGGTQLSISLDKAQKPQPAVLEQKKYTQGEENKKSNNPFLVSWGFNAAQFRDGMAYIRPTAPSQKELDTLALYATDPEKALEQAKQMSK